MTTLTVCLPRSLGGGAIAAQDIFTMGDRLKMVRVATAGVTAEMVKLKTWRDRAVQALPKKNVKGA